jgi:dTDP-4-dehydrorhamnose reductase
VDLDRISNTRILLTGAGGLLGTAFQQALACQVVIPLSRDRLSPDNPDSLEKAINLAAPDIVINCAAHTDVEAAERDPTVNFQINGRLPGLLGEICGKMGIFLVHFSSTGCYGNWKLEPYIEEDILRPTTAHHRAKLAGEEAVRESGASHLVLRTGWLYGGLPSQPKNFVWNRLVEAMSKVELVTNGTQRGCPTFAGDLVKQTLVLLKSGQIGIFNATSQGSASRYEYIACIIRAAHLPCLVQPGSGFSRLAQVSDNEMSLNRRLDAEGLDVMPHWQPAVTGYVETLIRSQDWQNRLRSAV